MPVSYSFGPFLVENGVLYRDGTRIALTPKAVEILQILLAAEGKIVSKDELMKAVWPDTFVDESTLTSNISILRKTLGTDPSGATYIETIPKRGYRFVPKAPQTASDRKPASAPTAQTSNAQRRTIWTLSIAAFVLAVLVGSALFWFRISRKSHEPRIMVAVLPVQNLTGDASKEYIADGLTEEFIAQLSSLNPERLGVIARTSSMAYKTTAKTAQQISRELHVEYLVESSIRQFGNDFRVNVQVVRANDQSYLWSAEYNRSSANLFSLQDELAQAIALQVRVELANASHTRISAARALNPDAYLAYLQGRFYWNERSPKALEQSIASFQRAIQIDPGYALAYSGLADTYSSQCLITDAPGAEVFPKAKAAALKAIQLDENLAEGHNSLAYVLFWYDWDWNAAEREFRRALDLNPGYAMAHQWYSMYLALMGREQEAIAENQRALELDPVSRIINMESGLPYFFLHRFDDAIPRFRRALELDPNFALARCDLAWAHLAKRDTQSAITELEQIVQVNDSSAILSTLASAYGDAGRHADAQRVLDRLTQRASERHVSPFFFATVYISLKQYDQALSALERGYANRDWVMVWTHVTVRMDPLRSDPRFKELLHKMNLQEYQPNAI